MNAKLCPSGVGGLGAESTVDVDVDDQYIDVSALWALTTPIPWNAQIFL
jgi:hypothetical protein